ncbi:MAG: DUF3718 domain-containing protein [Alteromonadaceae bacterium]|nr:DUF3718 domain-containing protein [Alteromonadaceae bacterium]
MKKLMLIAAAASVLSLSTTVSAQNYLTDDELVELCEAVKSNNRFTLVNRMEKYRVNFRVLSKGLVCDGHDVATFAQMHGADKNVKLIVRRTDLKVDGLLSKR